MKIINLKQGTPEWLEWRNNGIGASEIGSLMGVNDRITPRGLYDIKTGKGPETYVNEAMKYGNEQEWQARDWLESHFDCSLSNICIESEEKSFMRASLDGFDELKNILVEIKSPYNKENLDKMIQGDIPLSYLYQIQWQMLLTKMDSAFMCVWDGDKCHIHEIEEDKVLQKKMENKATKFWKDLIRGIEPPAEERDYEDISSDNMEVLDKVKSFKEAMEAKSNLEKVLKELKPEIEKLGENKNFIIHGVKFTRCMGSSRYDYSLMKEEGVELDRFKKPGNPFYRTTILR